MSEDYDDEEKCKWLYFPPALRTKPPGNYDDEENCKWLYWTGFVLVFIFTGLLIMYNSPIFAALLYINAAFGVALKRWRIERNARKERKDGPC